MPIGVLSSYYRQFLKNTTNMVCGMPHIGYFGYADFAVPLHRQSDKQDEATA